MDEAVLLAKQLALRQRPQQRQVMYQTWRDLLFLHWKVDPAVIQATLPDGLTVDTFEGDAYLGIVPFYMRRIRPKFLPPVPGISWFLETNVRTYVYDKNGTRGVWFYSLDCNQGFAVWAARTFFKLPYFKAKMQAKKSKDGFIHYECRRRGTSRTLASRFRYRGIGAGVSAEPNTLEFFLIERYILFAQTKHGLASGQVHHAPYQISAAEVSSYDAHLLTLNQFEIAARPPDNILFSQGVTVDVFPIRPIS